MSVSYKNRGVIVFLIEVFTYLAEDLWSLTFSVAQAFLLLFLNELHFVLLSFKWALWALQIVLPRENLLRPFLRRRVYVAGAVSLLK